MPLKYITTVLERDGAVTWVTSRDAGGEMPTELEKASGALLQIALGSAYEYAGSVGALGNAEGGRRSAEVPNADGEGNGEVLEFPGMAERLRKRFKND